MLRKLMNAGVIVGLVASAVTLHAQAGRGMRLLSTEVGRPGKVVKGAPFSADITNETTRTLPDGNVIHQTSAGKFYRDSEGRTRREPSLQSLGSAVVGGRAPRLAFIYDPVASVSYALNLVNRNATRTLWPQVPAPGTANNLNRNARPAQPNVKKESLGTQVYSGLVADVTRNTQIIHAGQIGNAQAITIVSERWYSPDLQVVLYSKRSDPRDGDTVYQLTNINRVEPAANLFAVPSDFSVSDAAPRQRGAGGPR